MRTFTIETRAEGGVITEEAIEDMERQGRAQIDALPASARAQAERSLERALAALRGNEPIFNVSLDSVVDVLRDVVARLDGMPSMLEGLAQTVDGSVAMPGPHILELGVVSGQVVVAIACLAQASDGLANVRAAVGKAERKTTKPASQC